MNIKITKLFNKFNYDISLDNKLNVLVGENGCGKTTIMKIVDYVLNGDYISLYRIPFEKIEMKIDDEIIIIEHSDLEQIKMTTNPEFRFYFNEIIKSKYNSFADFYKDVLGVESKMNEYAISISDDEDYLAKPNLFLKEDNVYFQMNDYVEKLSNIKVIYGSKKYFEIIFQYLYPNYRKGLSSIFYTFVDLTDKNFDLKVADKELLGKIIDRYMPEKKVELINDKVELIDKMSNEIVKIDQLSSGEIKMIKILNVIYNCDENTILLLDEPELSLSIYWQREIIIEMLNECKAKQIVVASQSPNLLLDDEIDYLVPIFTEE